MTGHARQGPITPRDSARQRQGGLAWAAKKSRNRRFQAREDRLARPDLLGRAWQEGRAHGGAAGIDGVPLEAGERHGGEQVWTHSRQDRRAGPSRPHPVWRLPLPQPDGGQRP